ncbi:MAG: transposase [Trueperaceae bacterium]
MPTLEPGHIILMDNVTIHHNHAVQTLIESKKCSVLYLPTDSPDFNPIEHLFAKLKAFIRKLRPDSLPKLIKTFEDAVLSVLPSEVKNAFHHCGYVSQ